MFGRKRPLRSVTENDLGPRDMLGRDLRVRAGLTCRGGTNMLGRDLRVGAGLTCSGVTYLFGRDLRVGA